MRAILTYHSVDGSGSPISISPAGFRRHVEWLASGRVRVVGLDELVAGQAENAVALTFDDGFLNFATEAAPLLAEHGLPVTVFVVSDHVGRTNAWGGRPAPGIPELGLLGWDALGRLFAEGVTIGAHTRTHLDLTTVDLARLGDELDAAAARIESELGTRPRWLAYPFGAVDQAVAAEARRRYAGAVTTEHRVLGRIEDRLRLPRLDGYYFQRPHAFDRWGTPAFRRSVWLRRQARRARAAVIAPRRPR